MEHARTSHHSCLLHKTRPGNKPLIDSDREERSIFTMKMNGPEFPGRHSDLFFPYDFETLTDFDSFHFTHLFPIGADVEWDGNNALRWIQLSEFALLSAPGETCNSLLVSCQQFGFGENVARKGLKFNDLFAIKKIL